MKILIWNFCCIMSDLGGAHGIMFTVTGNGYGDLSSNPGQSCLHSR